MKVRPIDAYKLTVKLKDLLKDFSNSPTKQYVIKIILSMLGDETQTPTLDNEPVVHAHWIQKGFECVCSNCGSIEGAFGINYCQDCGAKMDEEAEQDMITGTFRHGKEYECKICGKHFWVFDPEQWVYKNTSPYQFFCSYTCYRVWQKAQEERLRGKYKRKGG